MSEPFACRQCGQEADELTACEDCGDHVCSDCLGVFVSYERCLPCISEQVHREYDCTPDDPAAIDSEENENGIDDGGGVGAMSKRMIPVEDAEEALHAWNRYELTGEQFFASVGRLILAAVTVPEPSADLRALAEAVIKNQCDQETGWCRYCTSLRSRDCLPACPMHVARRVLAEKRDDK